MSKLTVWWHLRRLTKADPEVRSRAAAGLSGSKDPRAIKGLEEALADPDARARVAAASALGTTGDGATSLLPLLNDPVEEVRVAAANSLGSLRCGEAVIPLIKLFELNQKSLSNACTSALRKIGAPAVDPLVDALLLEGAFMRCRPCVSENARQALVAIRGTLAFDAFVKASQRSKRHDSKFFVDCFVQIGKPTFEIPLLRALQTQQDVGRPALRWGARAAAIQALVKLGWKPANSEQRALEAAARRDYKGATAQGRDVTELLSKLVLAELTERLKTANDGWTSFPLSYSERAETGKLLNR